MALDFERARSRDLLEFSAEHWRRTCITFVMVCLPLFSQTNTGRILGTVYDKTQAVVPTFSAVA